MPARTRPTMATTLLERAAAREPRLLLAPGPRRPRGIALLASGGSSEGVGPALALAPPALRMYPFLAALARAGTARGLLAAQLRYRVRGYNAGDPVRDVEWALGRLAARFPDVPVCLVGHSMGGRAVLRAAGHPAAAAVAALAPWLPPGEPVAQLGGRSVVIAHARRDRVTDPARSYRYALAARPHARRLCRFVVERSGHAMLGRARVWHSLVGRFSLAALELEPWDAQLEAAFALPGEAGSRIVI